MITDVRNMVNVTQTGDQRYHQTIRKKTYAPPVTALFWCPTLRTVNERVVIEVMRELFARLPFLPGRYDHTSCARTES